MTNKVVNETTTIATTPPTVTDLTNTLGVLEFPPQVTPALSTSNDSQSLASNPPTTLSLQSGDNAGAPDFSLNDIFVALESIRPSKCSSP